MTDIVIIIPAYNPDEKFIKHLTNLKDAGYERIIVINDGSRSDTAHFFAEAQERFNCDVVTHYVNLGQGRAYKTGFNYYMGNYAKDSIGLIQCDCDGQHDIEDINRCANLLRQNPDKFILGVRDFHIGGVPLRSRLGNDITAIVFKVFCGLDINDTQTGLKGIPTSFIPRLMEVKGERFEYASSVLLETRDAGVEILQFPIKTIYIDENASSHFNPLLDSIRIYALLGKYILSSLSAFIVDIVAFSVFVSILINIRPADYIIWSTYCAKVISCTWTFLVNKNLVFKDKAQGNTPAAIKFVCLCVVQATLSAFMTNGLVQVTHWYEVFCKIIVDTILFFLSFQVQNRWVFRKRT